jgi:hypothetical protein
MGQVLCLVLEWDHSQDHRRMAACRHCGRYEPLQRPPGWLLCPGWRSVCFVPGAFEPPGESPLSLKSARLSFCRAGAILFMALVGMLNLELNPTQRGAWVEVSGVLFRMGAFA